MGRNSFNKQSRFERRQKKQSDLQKLKAKNIKNELLEKQKTVEKINKNGGNIKLDKSFIKDDKKFKKEVKKQQKKIRVNLKRQALSIDYPDALTNKYSDSFIDKISWKTIRNGTFKLDINVKDFKFDYDKVYVLKEPFRLGFVDWSENLGLEEIYRFYKGLSIEELERELKAINSKRVTGTGKAGTSSGEAGGYTLETGSYNILKKYVRDRANDTKRWKRYAKERNHTSKNVGWQWFTKSGKREIDSLTPREVLVIANTIMHHVDENSREDFYSDFYDIVKDNIPEIILPKPKISW